MRKKQANATTIRLESPDREAIERIKELYGCPSDSAAVKLALRMVARGEHPKRSPTTPTPRKEGRIPPQV